MVTKTRRRGKPPITMTERDHGRLTLLAESHTRRDAAVAEQLMAELDRARVVADTRARPDVVRMGSTVRFTANNGDDQTVTLVYPVDADIAKGRMSILTPVGAALIGLSAGQSMEWTTRDGRTLRLTVESVENGADIRPDS